ncbi:hypothetical protein ACYOEI_37985, partial [Singulisphaera rosea]
DPPYLLHEGWAVAQAGLSSFDLARDALDYRKHFGPLRLADMLSSESYHRILEPDYVLGGAFVDFLVRRHGSRVFLDFYNSIRPETVDAACLDHFGVEFDALEVAFWKDAERLAPGFK